MFASSKPAKSRYEQLLILKGRGLVIDDEERVLHYLSTISYYRFSAYTRFYYQCDLPEHRFKAGVRFQQVLDLYIFDRRLRLLFLDAIERIEVALRAELTNCLAQNYGPHGYLTEDVFHSKFDLSKTTASLKKTMAKSDAETFVQHYRSNYRNSPEEPPIWMACELLTFGEVSHLFANLKHPTDTQWFEGAFGFKYPVLQSWFRSLSDLRNVCAHHGRLWNREFGSRPCRPKEIPAHWPQLPQVVGTRIDPQRRLYLQIIVILGLLEKISPHSTWKTRLLELFHEFGEFPKQAMGFPDGWELESFWANSESFTHSHQLNLE